MPTNAEVFDAFVSGKSLEGGNVRSVEYSSGNYVLFSYETPVAYKRLDTGAVFITDRKYSVTTSKQCSGIVRACIIAGIFCERMEAGKF